MAEYKDVVTGVGAFVRLPQSVWLHSADEEPSEDNSITVYHDIKRGEWAVSLPHQCDTWDIAYGKSATETMSVLDEFIAALSEAREQLREPSLREAEAQAAQRPADRMGL